MNHPGDEVGFIGLGAMGIVMAGHIHDLLGSGGLGGEPRKLHVHNRSMAKADALLKRGAIWEDSAAAMASRCQLVFSMLADDGALTAVFESYLSGKPSEGSVYVDCSTVAPETTAALASRAQAAGLQYVSAPIFGRPDAVAAKKVINVLAGPPDAKSRVRPILEALGRGVMDVGDDPRLGSVMKLVGNFHIASIIELIAEGMTLGESNGLSRDTLLQFYSFMLPGPLVGGYAARLAGDEFERTEEEPGFAASLAMKDVGHIIDLGRASKVPLPLADTVMSHLKQAVARGRGQQDWGAIAAVVREDSGQ